MKDARGRLPVRITLMLWVVLLTTVWNLIRVWSSFTLREALLKYAPWPGPVYIGLTGGVSAVGGVVILWALWRRAGWFNRALLGGAIGYAAWYWLDRLVVQPRSSQGWPFSLFTTLVLLALVAAIALDPRTRQYFGKEAHEREQQHRKTA